MDYVNAGFIFDLFKRCIWVLILIGTSDAVLEEVDGVEVLNAFVVDVALVVE